MKTEARLGFVGCGSHATNNHYPSLMYTRGRLVAVCDLNRELAERNARLFGAERVFTDATRMLDECELDGVIVVGPPEAHVSVGREVLRRGIPLLTEKPPAPTLAEAEELVALARAQRTFWMPGFMKRHGLTYRHIRRAIERGEFTPAAATIQFGHWPGTDLRLNLLYMWSHALDLAVSFFGAPRRMVSVQHRTPHTLSLGVTLQFPSGVWAQLMLDSSQPRIQERVAISGRMGEANALFIADNVERLELHRQGQNGIDLLAPTLPEINPTFDLADIQVWRPDYGLPNMGQSRRFFQGFAPQAREFVDAILEQREPYPGTADILPTMRLIEALATRPDGETVWS